MPPATRVPITTLYVPLLHTENASRAVLGAKRRAQLQIIPLEEFTPQGQEWHGRGKRVVTEETCMLQSDFASKVKNVIQANIVNKSDHSLYLLLQFFKCMLSTKTVSPVKYGGSYTWAHPTEHPEPPELGPSPQKIFSSLQARVLHPRPVRQSVKPSSLPVCLEVPSGADVKC